MMYNYRRTPQNNKPLSLFEYSVGKVIELGMMGQKKSHQAWATIIFDYEKDSWMRSDLMSIVKREYKVYFNEENHYMFLEEKIKNNFPYLFGLKEETDLFKKMMMALDAELAEQKSPRNRKSYKVEECNKISSTSESYVYKSKLVIEEGDDPHLVEGMPLEYRSSSQISYQCEVVEFDFVNAILFFSCERDMYIGHDSRIILDATYNIIALQKRIEDIASTNISPNQPLWKFLNEKTRTLSNIQHGDIPDYLIRMFSKDASQLEAFKAAINKDITFIWGPPGTGKSYTLAAIIMALYQMGQERTAVCCLSNVAVDQLANKVVKIIDENLFDMPNGEFYRAGRTQDEVLLNKQYLFPDDEVSNDLREEIRKLYQRVKRFKERKQQYSDDAIKYKAELKDKREKLKEHTDYLISQVKVVFSTISNFVINPRLWNGEFDNLIVDEASMLAEPQLIALARNVKKRIILVGDFQQLSPITTAGVPILRNSVFALCGIDINNTTHPALCPLLNQRRSNPEIVEMINKSFYSDMLKAARDKESKAKARPPYSGIVIGVKHVKDGEVNFTKGGTRQNAKNASVVMELLDKYAEDIEENFSIGVITPYTGQVAQLKFLFHKREYSTRFQERVKIGTVHTFQGSECDVIIFDMVDCGKFKKGEPYFGRIYAGEQGEELMNVAISRARDKLIVVCDTEFLNRCPGGVISDKTKSIFYKLLKHKFTKDQ